MAAAIVASSVDGPIRVSLAGVNNAIMTCLDQQRKTGIHNDKGKVR